ncbi:MAG: hypothetical protein ISQ34_04960 [Rickettsiales bacterium]|nr:hypothetical protein [Rickettsiales bacterium]
MAQELLGRFHDWSVYRADRGDKKVCYTISTPIDRKDNVFKRGESYFMVSEIKNDADEVSVSSGFMYDDSMDVEISFRSKKFYLFPHKNLAWANDKNEDIDIIKEMQKFDDFIVRGDTKKGKYGIDTYSLIGFKESYYLLKEKCG